MASPTTIDELRRALRRLEDERRRIDEQHRAILETLRYFDQLRDVGDPDSGRVGTASGSGHLENRLAVDPSETVHSEIKEASTGDGLRDAIYGILSAEHPLHRRTIHDRLLEKGVRIGGRDPVNNVGAHLSLDDRFMSLGMGLWDLVEQSDGRTETAISSFETADENNELEDEENVPW